MNKSSTLRTALVAVSGSLAVAPAGALELGDAKVHSTLGQPLRASITYALAPNEQLADTCVSLLPGRASSGLPTVHGGSVIVANGVIAITGNAVMREPLAAMRVAIRCPYTAQLTREYMLFIDPADAPAQPVAEQATTPSAVPESSESAAPAPRTATPVTRREPVNATGRYRVQAGDTLSEIAQRIENRPVGVWTAVNALYVANPDAFIDGDMSRLKAGAWLTIPDFDLDAAPVAAATTVKAIEAPPSTTTYTPENLVEPSPPAESAPVSILDPAFQEAETATVPTAAVREELQPGEVVTQPLDTVVDDSTIIPDTELTEPATSSAQPNSSVAIIRPAAGQEAGSTNWLAWFAGAGIALLAGLLGFGWFRGRFGSTPVGSATVETTPRRRATDTQRVEAIGDVDYDLADDSPTAENLALDADLITGTGFEEGAAVDVTEDFAFASTTQLDIELPEEIELPDETSYKEDDLQTDIIPPLNIDAESILESEVLPDADDDEDDYDMSVIVDATKMPDPADVTEHDLEAIEVPDSDGTLITGDYTLSQEADYKILEQDYQDELTATQRLNEEIRKAAEDLAPSDDEDASDSDDTKEMSTATVYELDVTTQMQSRNDDDFAPDDETGLDLTINMDADDKTVEMPDDKTVEMPKRGKAG